MTSCRTLMIWLVLGAPVAGLNSCSRDKDREPGVAVLTLKDSFRHALARRIGKEAELAHAEFERLLESWKPVGRTETTLRETLGPPDREEPGAMIYCFDTGWNALEYVFIIESGKVTKVVVNS